MQLDALDAASLHTDALNIEEAVAAHEEGERIHTALEMLPVEQREVIELAYFGGMSHSEIAARLGQPLGTVKTRTRLAMMKLRDLLKESNKGHAGSHRGTA